MVTLMHYTNYDANPLNNLKGIVMPRTSQSVRLSGLSRITCTFLLPVGMFPLCKLVIFICRVNPLYPMLESVSF